MAYLPPSTKSKTTGSSKSSKSKSSPPPKLNSHAPSSVKPVKGKGGKFFKVNPFPKKVAPLKGDKINPKAKAIKNASGKSDASIHLKGTHKNAAGKTTPVKVKPVAAPAPASPFLTPAQQKAVSDFDTTFGYNLQKLQRNSADATVNTNQNLANDQHMHDVNTNVANQTMAARGLFQSSIRAGDLNDIDATLAMRNNILNNNLHTKLIDNGARSGQLTTNWSVFHNYYNSLAVQNAQAITPATSNPTPPANAVKPAAPKPAAPKAPTKKQPPPANGLPETAVGFGGPSWIHPNNPASGVSS